MEAKQRYFRIIKEQANRIVNTDCSTYKSEKEPNSRSTSEVGKVGRTNKRIEILES